MPTLTDATLDPIERRALLARAAAAAQDDREDVDLQARLVSDEEARSALAVAGRFVAAVAAVGERPT